MDKSVSNNSAKDRNCDFMKTMAMSGVFYLYTCTFLEMMGIFRTFRSLYIHCGNCS